MNRRALIVWGGWDGHTPRQSADLFGGLLREAGYDVRSENTLDAYLDPRLSDLNLIVPIWTMGIIREEQEKGLLAAIAEGVGLAGFHGGMIDSFRNNTEYQFMTGGQWVAHPGGCIPAYDVHLVDREHPITRGLNNFTLHDTEQYWMHVDPSNHVLAATTFSGAHGDRSLYKAGTIMPYAWTKHWGRGRVFVAAWGHTYRDFDTPEAREIVRRGMLWAARD